jgi:PAS domain-containing protein
VAARVQHDVEVILMKQVASYLAMPVFVVDLDGNLVYFNEPAESMLGLRYEETDELPMSKWSTIFNPTDEHGSPIPPGEVPLARALQERRPGHMEMWIKGLDGADRHISVTAFPLVGQHDRNLGAVAIFWEDRR